MPIDSDITEADAMDDCCWEAKYDLQERLGVPTFRTIMARKKNDKKAIRRRQTRQILDLVEKLRKN